MSTPTIPSPRKPVDTTNAAHPRRVRVVGDLFHGRVPWTELHGRFDLVEVMGR